MSVSVLPGLKAQVQLVRAVGGDVLGLEREHPGQNRWMFGATRSTSNPLPPRGHEPGQLVGSRTVAVPGISTPSESCAHTSSPTTSSSMERTTPLKV